jgi:membrane glycosyltransferase
VLSYASSPLWLLVLLLSSTVVILDALHGHQYFKPGSYALFPSWPQYRDGEIVALLSITVAVLFLPKFFGALLALKDSRLRRGFGGGGRLFASLGLEQLFSILLAPAMMLFHTTFVVTTLAGKPVAWHAQERGDRGIGVLEALLRHKWHLVIGIVWGGVILAFAPRYIWWLLPVLAGMVLSVPLTVLTSRTGPALWLRKHRLLLTPEEAEPPPELAALQARLGADAGAAQAADSQAPNDAPDALTLPERVPLSMQAQPPRYFTARDALRIRRWRSAAS